MNHFHIFQTFLTLYFCVSFGIAQADPTPANVPPNSGSQDSGVSAAAPGTVVNDEFSGDTSGSPSPAVTRLGAPTVSPEATRRYNVAVGLFNSKMYTDALEKWNDFISNHPDDERILAAKLYRCYCCFFQKQYENYESGMKELLSVPPDQFSLREDALEFAALAAKGQGSRSPAFYVTAEKYFNLLLKEFPESKKALVWQHHLGQVLYQQGKNDLAAKQFLSILQPANQAEPVYIDATVDYVRVLLDQGNYEKCTTVINFYLKRFSSHARKREILLYKGDLLFVQNQYQNALSEYKASMTPSANEPEFVYSDYALMRVGDCHSLLGQTEESAQAYVQVISRYPKSPYVPTAKLNAGRCYSQLRWDDKAVQYLTEAQQSPATSGSASLFLSELELKRSNPVKALEYINQVPQGMFCCQTTDTAREQKIVLSHCNLKARILLQNPDKLQEAVVLLESMAALWPKDVMASWALYYAAEASFKLKDYSAALERCQRLEKLYPGSSEIQGAQILAAESMFCSGQFAQAAEKFIGLYTANPTAKQRFRWLLRGCWAYDQQGEYQKIRQTLLPVMAQMAKTEKDLQPEAAYCMGKAMLELNEQTAAVSYLEICKKESPDFPAMDRVLLLLGRGYRLLGKTDLSSQALTAVMEKFPQSPVAEDAIFEMGRLKSLDKDSSSALAFYQTLIDKPKDNPLRPQSIIDSACIYLDENKTEDAIKRITMFITDYTDNDSIVEAYYVRAAIYDQQDKSDLALADTQKAIEIVEQRKIGDTWLNSLLAIQGTHLSRQGNHPDAVQTFAKLFARRNKGSEPLPNEDALSFLYANSLMQAGKTELSKKVYQWLYNKYKDSPYRYSAAFALGLEAIQSGDTVKAKKLLAEAAGSESIAMAVKAQSRLAWLVYSQKQYGQAFMEFQALLTKKRKLHAELITSSEASGQTAEKKTAEKKTADDDGTGSAEQTLLALTPIFDEAEFMLAECLYFQNKYSDALKYYKQLHSVTPDQQLLITFHESQSSNNCNDFPYTIQVTNRVLQNDNQLKSAFSSDPREFYLAILFEKARALMKTGKTEEAKLLFETITSAAEKRVSNTPLPESADIAVAKSWFYRGELEFQAQQYTEAIRFYFQVIYGYSWPQVQADACYEAARCFEMLKMPQQAQKQYKLLVEKFPDNPNVPAAKQKLEQK